MPRLLKPNPRDLYNPYKPARRPRLPNLRLRLLPLWRQPMPPDVLRQSSHGQFLGKLPAAADAYFDRLPHPTASRLCCCAAAQEGQQPRASLLRSSVFGAREAASRSGSRVPRPVPALAECCVWSALHLSGFAEPLQSSRPCNAETERQEKL